MSDVDATLVSLICASLRRAAQSWRKNIADYHLREADRAQGVAVDIEALADRIEAGDADALRRLLAEGFAPDKFEARQAAFQDFRLPIDRQAAEGASP